MSDAAEKNGGPAFPHPDCTFVNPYDPGMREVMVQEHRGMSLRDWFAGQVMVGLSRSGVEANYDEAHIAATCWRLADAMLAERAQQPTADEPT